MEETQEAERESRSLTLMRSTCSQTHSPMVHTTPPGRSAACIFSKNAFSNNTDAGPTGSDESTMIAS